MNELFENWETTKEALLDGLDSQKRGIISPLLDNQKNHAMMETAAAGSTDAHSIAGFRNILIPMIRRIIPGTIATEIVGVQAMTGPVGLVYSLRYQYADSLGNTPSNGFPAGATNITAGDEAFGNTEQGGTPVRSFYAGAAGDNSPAGGADAQAAGAGGLTHGSPVSLDGSAAYTADGVGYAWPSSLDASSGATVGGSGSFIEGSGGRKMTLEVVSQAIEAGTRKLQSGWTIEAMQDLKSQHGMDLESEMTKALSAEIVQEIDHEILADLVALAGTVATFSGDLAGSPANYTPAYTGDRFANLATMINYVANEIGRRTRRGSGNFIVVSPMIVSVLQSASRSVFAPSTSGSFKGPNNTMLVGTLNSTIKVYSYLWNQVRSTDVGGNGNDTILVGFKGGNGETDTGYFYCPYIPLMSSGVVVNPVTFQPVVSLMTRYGKAIFTNTASSLGNSADYYGKVNVSAMSFA